MNALHFMKPKTLQTTAAFLLLAETLLLSGALAQGQAFSDTNWLSLGGVWTPTGRGNVSATVVDSAGNLYIGGHFTRAGSTSATNIAKWDGTTWSALGPGLGSSAYGAVDALAVSGTNVYAGGTFTNAGVLAASKIAQWNGSAWSALGTGMGSIGIVFALAVSDSTLYAGGSFASAGGVPANYVAQWNGSSWSALNSGQWNCYSVYSLAVSGSTLYAGGNFSMAGGVAATNIAAWNGGSWSALGSGVSGGSFPLVYALAVSGSTLYVCGQFTNAGGATASSIAQWNGSSWSALGSGVSGGALGPVVQALAVANSAVYAGGDFNFAGGLEADYIAKWNGSSWSGLGSGLNNQVNALALSGANLYVGGVFTTAGTNAAPGVAEAAFPKLPATVTLGNLVQAFDGSPKYVTYSTSPPGLPVTITYLGSYTVIGTINDPSYQGSATNTLTIILQLTAPAWTGSNGFQFSFNTASGVTYTIQLSSDLKTWTPALVFSGSGGPLTIFDPNARSSGRRFYRVMVLP